MIREEIKVLKQRRYAKIVPVPPLSTKQNALQSLIFFFLHGTVTTLPLYFIAHTHTHTHVHTQSGGARCTDQLLCTPALILF